MFIRRIQIGLRTSLLIILAILFMFLDKHWSSFASLRTALSLSFASIQYVIHWPIYYFDQFKVYFQNKETLIAQNEHLRAQHVLLRARLQRFMMLESENMHLKALMHMAKQVNTRMQMAELLSVNGEPYIKKIWLNSGSHDGVYVGQCVLDAYGVMGQVIQVSPLTSEVLLINDPRNGVSVQDMRNGVRAIAMGDPDSNQLRLMYIPKTIDIRIGDLFVTSGLGEHYPAGYLVGKAVAVIKNSTQPFMIIYLQPSAHLYRSRQVLLIWPQHQ